MTGEKISIIVVSYNHGHYIKECLDSILSQTYTNWELIVADDASKDDSTTVYEQWLAAHGVQATKVFNQANLGLCKTLNKCLSICSGTYVKMIAADDWLKDDYLEKMMAAFQSEPDDVGLLFSNAEYFNESGLMGKKFFSVPPDIGNGWIHERLLTGNFIPALTVFVKRSVFDTVGLFDEHIWIEDWEYWLRASLKYRFKYVDEALAFYRMHGNNVSKNTEKLIKGELQIITKFGDDIRWKKVVNDFFRDRYYIANDKKYVLELFNNYRFKNKVLYLFFKYNLPRKLYRSLQLLARDRF